MILAGGRSSRMGRDKAIVEIAGKPLIRQLYDTVAACEDRAAIASGDRLNDRIYVVTPWVERYQSILPITCNFIVEQQRYQGPPIAFARALTEISSTWVLLLACDLPNLSMPLLQSWIDRLPSVPQESTAYLPKHASKGWEPLCGFYRASCRHSLLAYLHDGGRSFQGWLNLNMVTELIIANPSDLANCNTPEDLAAVIEDRSIDLE
jgi:molybdenum cofactor guanylyltransferase